jgi:hypothetical protein
MLGNYIYRPKCYFWAIFFKYLVTVAGHSNLAQNVFKKQNDIHSYNNFITLPVSTQAKNIKIKLELAK